MSILYMNLGLVYMLSMFARKVQSSSIRVSYLVPARVAVFLAIVVFVCVSGLRKNIGDTFFYMHSYEITTYTWSQVQAQSDIGFGLLQMFLKNISGDPQLLVFTTALITNTLIVLVLYNYSKLFELSLYVYITGGLFIVSMNGIRQVLAAAIAFTAIKYIMNGNMKRYIAVVLVASLFHQSALILIPIYFLVRFKAWSKATVALLLLSVVIVVGFEQFSNLLFNTIEGTQYEEYKDFQEGGANFLRVVVYGAPLIVAFFGKDKLREIFPNSDYMVNLTLVGLVFMIVSTQNWIFARFSIYFTLYQLILISWIVKLFRPRDEKLIYFALIVLYFGYFYFENDLNMNLQYESDYLVW
ncbi:EpsG family protein [Halobacillus litoralis]|uniref:EpsG family protein n=1 Tax=Halobacillus litoralis TaxID=45668 RepID=A0A845F7S6_9BACI|nr:EpsG family protein [Halobacillus litoralis]MYL69901.1 EpsG family protein [Halobacillus litoralis]